MAAGFWEASQRGSHVKFVKTTAEGTRTAIVPHHAYDVPLGTLGSVLNQAGITPDELGSMGGFGDTRSAMQCQGMSIGNAAASRST